MQEKLKSKKSNKKNNNMKGTRPLTGPALTNDLCGQNVKVKVKTALIMLSNILPPSGVVPSADRRG